MNPQPDPPSSIKWLQSARPVPPIPIPTSLRNWSSQRRQIRARLRKLLGNLPPRPHRPQIETLTKTEADSYSLEKFRFDNGAGATVSGYLFLPKPLRGKVPAILYCHWHGAQYDVGKEEMLDAEHTPVPPGPAFAARGCAVLGIDCYGFGERNGAGPGGPSERGQAGEMTASKFNLWFGRTLWGMILRDDLMALDYLLTRPEVDASRIGVTGISMGATRSWWLMALDDRIKAGVAVGCLTRAQELIAHEGLHHHGIYYFVPGMLANFDTEAVIACIAPRPILFQTGDRDGGSPADGIRAVESAVRPVYRLLGAEGAFESILYPGVGHVYTPEMWDRTLAWMERELKLNEFGPESATDEGRP